MSAPLWQSEHTRSHNRNAALPGRASLVGGCAWLDSSTSGRGCLGFQLRCRMEVGCSWFILGPGWRSSGYLVSVLMYHHHHHYNQSIPHKPDHTGTLVTSEIQWVNPNPMENHTLPKVREVWDWLSAGKRSKLSNQPSLIHIAGIYWGLIVC